MNNIVFNNNTPLNRTPSDTGQDLNGFNSTGEVTALLKLQKNGVDYVAYVTANIQILKMNVDVHGITNAELVDASNDVSLELWFNSTTSTLWYDIDVDGSGVTLVSFSLITKELQIV